MPSVDADISLTGAAALGVQSEVSRREGVSAVSLSDTSVTFCVSVIWRDGLLWSCSGVREVVRRGVPSCSCVGITVCGMFCVGQ